HPRDVAGDPDLLNITRPEVVLEIHRQYFAAGADIATTNTFTATSIGQADYGLEAHVREMNLEGARLAPEAAAEGKGFVAGTRSRSSSASTARSGRARCGRSSRTSPGSRRPGSRATRTRGCRTRWGRTTSSRATRAATCASSPRRASSTWSAAAAAPRPNTSR